MPNESVNLYLSIQSGSSERTLTSLTDKTRSLDKETQLLQQATDGMAKANKPLLEQQTRLQSELKSSQKTVNELQKAYDEYGDELSKLRLDQAVDDHAKLKQELTEVNAQLGANQRTYKEYLETVRKGGLQDESGGLSSLAKGLATSAVGSMLASSFGGFFNTYLTSAIGTPEASMISNTLSSAISGATAGAVAGLPGIILGGLLGSISGVVSGSTQIYQAKDDAFKEYYNQLVDTYGGLNAGNTAAGSAIAAGREADLISFSTMFGSQDAAEEYLRSLVDMSNRTPFLYDDLTAMSKTLATYGYDENSILPVLQTIGDAGAALGQSTGDMTSVATAIGRMVSSDKATLEYLNILNDRGINAIGYLAEARGKSVADTYADISKGNISGTEAAEIILAALEQNYGANLEAGRLGAMEQQSKTFAGLTSTLEGLQQEVANAAGESYNTLRKEAIQTEIDSLSGALGSAMQEINTIIGENQARSENLREEYMRAAISAVLLGEDNGLFDEAQQAQLDEWAAEYADAAERYAAGEEKAGLEMQALYENAQIMAQAWYDSSEWAQAEVDAQLEQIAAIRDNTAGLAAATDAYRLAQEESKGLAAVSMTRSESIALGLKNFGFDESDVQRLSSIIGGGGEGTIPLPGTSAYKAWLRNGNRNAYGLDRVPFDDYPALLHEGERVLTAGEARAMDEGGGGTVVQVTVTGNNFMGTGEEMADQIAEILVRKLERADTAAGR